MSARCSSPAAPAAVVAAPDVTAGHPDQVVLLCEKLAALEAAQRIVSDEHVMLQSDFVRQHGSRLRGNGTLRDLWEADPRYPRLQQLMEKCDEYTSHITEMIYAIVDAHSTSVAGVLAKIRVAISQWPIRDAKPEFHEDIAIAVLLDTERALAALPDPRGAA